MSNTTAAGKPSPVESRTTAVAPVVGPFGGRRNIKAEKMNAPRRQAT